MKDDKTGSLIKDVLERLRAFRLRLKEDARMRRIAQGIGTLVALILMMAWLSGTFISKVEPGKVEIPEAHARTGESNPVREMSFSFEAEQVGTIKTKADTWVSSRVMAQVKEILVSEGSLVQGTESGSPTVLARLDDREFRAKVRQAESNLQAARRAVEMAKAQVDASKANLSSAKAQRDRVASDYRRYQELYKQGAATAQQLEHMRAQYITAEAQYSAALNQVQSAEAELSRAEAQAKQAEALLAEAKTMLDYTVIRAPFSGKVVKKTVEVGTMVTPGQPLFYLETPGQPELHAWVAESLLPYISVGQRFDVTVDALKKTVSGVVREIVPQAETTTRTVLVKIALAPDKDLVNGMFGRFNISYGSYSTLVIPRRSVREVGQIRVVDVVRPDGRISRRFVTLGKVHGDLVEVLSGLTAGEEVLVP
ncbi:MAG: efflux RND transporter periplasmic adaptor subunit [Thermodesulforhabdaceae bacterium]|jgi:multidrug resistance efflux pump